MIQESIEYLISSISIFLILVSRIGFFWVLEVVRVWDIAFWVEEVTFCVWFCQETASVILTSHDMKRLRFMMSVKLRINTLFHNNKYIEEEKYVKFSYRNKISVFFAFFAFWSILREYILFVSFWLMTKREYLLKFLTLMNPEIFPIYDDMKLLLERDKFSDQLLDVFIDAVKGAIHQTKQKSEKEKLLKWLNILEQLKEREKKEEKLNEEECLHIENMINDF